MSADRNIVELSGRLVRDIKLNQTKDGSVFAMITLVIRNKSQKKADFIDIFIWNARLIDFYGEYLKPGRRVMIRGTISKSEKGLLINVTEDYGMMLCYDVRDLKNAKEGSEHWIKSLETENAKYEGQLKRYEEGINNEKNSPDSASYRANLKLIKS